MHSGVDLIALYRAFWKTYFCGFRRGASTIAMQLVRTITGHYERTRVRKLTEIILAIRLTQYTGNNWIPILYLWVAYYGADMNSLQQACAKLKINPSEAISFELAAIVARIKYPEPMRYNRKRSYQILNQASYLVSFNYRFYKSRWPRLHRLHGTI